MYPNNNKEVSFCLFVYLFFFLKKTLLMDDGELKIEPTLIHPRESSRSRRQEWLYLVGRSSIGTLVIHEESTWTTPDTWENSRRVYLQELVNLIMCYYFEA